MTEWLHLSSLVAQRLKCLPLIWETWIWSLGQEDPLEKEMVTHSSILSWRIPWTEKCGRLQSTGSQRVRHDWAASLTYSLNLTQVRLNNKWNWKSLSRVRLFATPWTLAHQAPPSMGFSRKEYWSDTYAVLEMISPPCQVIVYRS